MNRIAAILHQGTNFGSHSGMYPLVKALGAEPVFYEQSWLKLQKKSWCLGQALRWWGSKCYGSTWNALIPVWDELRLARAVNKASASVVHFLWGEFASPRLSGLFRKRDRKLIGTFHCSARRQPSVLGAFKCLRSFDCITVMSKSQVPYFLERGVPAEKIKVALHGVDTDFFTPGSSRSVVREKSLQLLLVGSTERDHQFMTSVLNALPDDAVQFTALIDSAFRKEYQDCRDVRFISSLQDEDLREEYRKADLLIMPMFDCTANNAILESMSCGTPVMVNDVGGISEYVNREYNHIMNGKNTDEWVSLLQYLIGNPAELHSKQKAVRLWTEGFSWSRVVEMYRSAYASAYTGSQEWNGSER